MPPDPPKQEPQPEAPDPRFEPGGQLFKAFCNIDSYPRNSTGPCPACGQGPCKIREPAPCN